MRMQRIEDFYSDPRRQDSREVKFGSGWRSSKFEFFEFILFWVADTQELCLLRAPQRDVQSDGVFSRFILHVPPHTNPQPLRDEEVMVEVLAVLPEEQLSRVLQGWQDHVKDTGGVEWVRNEVAARFE